MKRLQEKVVKSGVEEKGQQNNRRIQTGKKRE